MGSPNAVLRRARRARLLPPQGWRSEPLSRLHSDEMDNRVIYFASSLVEIVGIILEIFLFGNPPCRRGRVVFSLIGVYIGSGKSYSQDINFLPKMVVCANVSFN
ncbi:MAG: hypothetical protein COU10_02360 [Candidatus Harrisonbacteria bacterium CG10_big_fil_rev_8_21_14_0_10_45_28]|uniref:Uncharacterized protein n=1 Tax=Candidatus Harrisonbacteria bacterium CG10_big_fil_rev_8_21_14_0_10_45_28 TaxID=1974586 RepID=A0A2H0UN59_9BACT|nr:MAG: hypothetical protein COU10_02360 [Candidatus Harrisonbacteria bacterium CG10_big_fil_rev_8_21_14_0_10_45_28]